MSSGLLAGIGLTRLRVYDQRPAPDGSLSGCAHVHAFTDEAYYVDWARHLSAGYVDHPPAVALENVLRVMRNRAGDLADPAMSPLLPGWSRASSRPTRT